MRLVFAKARFALVFKDAVHTVVENEEKRYGNRNDRCREFLEDDHREFFVGRLRDDPAATQERSDQIQNEEERNPGACADSFGNQHVRRHIGDQCVPHGIDGKKDC